MRHGHRAHDGQAQARARQRFTGAAAGETLLHRILFVVGDARPAVGHCQGHPVACHGRGLDIDGALRRVAQGVVHQVAQHLPQRHAIAGDAGAPHGRRDVDTQAPCLQRADAAAGFVDGLGHAHQRARALAQAVGDRGVHQQLIDELAGVGGILVDAAEALVQALGIGFIQRHFGLRAQRGQRRTHLVGGIGDQGIEGVHDARQALHESVQGFDQAPHLGGHGRDQRRQVVRRPLPQFALDHRQRREGALHAEP
ncbi:hypothetical protein LMG26696_05113 [Achromobacter pulmonis]|nr:hypothetical protein LMG26696_05113 [Achromobacter pulmonis]